VGVREPGGLGNREEKEGIGDPYHSSKDCIGQEGSSL